MVDCIERLVATIQPLRICGRLFDPSLCHSQLGSARPGLRRHETVQGNSVGTPEKTDKTLQLRVPYSTEAITATRRPTELVHTRGEGERERETEREREKQ